MTGKKSYRRGRVSCQEHDRKQWHARADDTVQKKIKIHKKRKREGKYMERSQKSGGERRKRRKKKTTRKKDRGKNKKGRRTMKGRGRGASTKSCE